MKTKNEELRFHRLLCDFLNDYLPLKRIFSPKTVTVYRQTMKIFRVYCLEEKGIRFDKMDFTALSQKNIYEFLTWLRDKKHNASSTLNLRLSVFKSFLKYCSVEDMTLMPLYLAAVSIHAFKEHKKTGIEYLTQDQLKLLFSIPNASTRIGRRDRFFMILAYETGCRMQELLELTLSNIIRDKDRIKIIVTGKGSKTRFVPITAGTVSHLEAYLKESHKSSDGNQYLFYTVHNGLHTQMHPGAVDHFLKKYGALAKEKQPNFPEGLHAHMLRHSIAMAMYKEGIPISYIRDFLGHSSVETTAIYSYADEETIAKALESVDTIFVQVSKIPSKKWKGREQYLIELCGLE